MSDFWTTINEHLIQSSVAILDALSKTRYDPPEGSADVNVKSILESLLANKNPNPNPSSAITETRRRLQDSSIKDFALACALLASARSSLLELLSWIPEHLADLACSAFGELAVLYCAGGGGLVSEEKGGLVAELMHLVLPLLKERIQDSSIDRSADGDEVSAASARVPVGYAIVAAYQFRWFVTQVEYPILGNLSTLVIPCGLTALDHWSPEVKGQGMISFIHLAKNVNAAQLGWYEDVILDACCQNIASSDEIWHLVVEMSVLLVTNIQRRNPRSQWYERILNEMLGHLERQPRNKDRRIAWLTFIEPLVCSVGIVLLAHSRRIFSLFFQWMHADDEQTVLLVLKRIQTVIRLTWIRNTPFIGRLVDELVALYKEAALRTSREEIRTSVLEILALLQRCKGLQFEEAWNKHKDDPNLMALNFPASGVNQKNIARCTEEIHSISI